MTAFGELGWMEIGDNDHKLKINRVNFIGGRFVFELPLEGPMVIRKGDPVWVYGEDRELMFLGGYLGETTILGKGEKGTFHYTLCLESKKTNAARIQYPGLIGG